MLHPQAKSQLNQLKITNRELNFFSIICYKWPSELYLTFFPPLNSHNPSGVIEFGNKDCGSQSTYNI